MNTQNPIQVRSVWISDIHLGFKGCQAEKLLDFLHCVETEYLFLVGDIIDFWSIKKSPYWPQSHTNVIRSILGKAKHNTKVIYIPGNHDEPLRDCVGQKFGNLEIHHNYLHTTADGKKLLVMHGDEFDVIVKHSRFLANLGSWAYEKLLSLNHVVNRFRNVFNLSYWSLAAFLKHKVKNAVSYIGSFEEALAHFAREEEVDGVVCGHIHHAEIREIEGVLYCNDGDWVESCTAMFEHPNGQLELISWTDIEQQRTSIADTAVIAPEKEEVGREAA